ncbi:MAG: L,D-transpeptidase family protein [Hyphomicrobiales bacterium]|nr:L,D-transpeptidase family protein [Hyphomicrobiales bacterium]MCP5001575.1 L,D-transpeptidase family protein [Hyphomicrobiales bacterium]
MERGTVRLIGWKTAIVVSGLALALTGCQDILESVDNRAEYKLPTKLVNKMKAHDQRVRAPVMMRIFKQEGILEVWKAKGTGRYALVKEYEICKWSGQLGPKFKEGDRQAPEGYYDIKPHQMNPNSSYYLSFNMGYPNRFDRAHNRTGSNLMVHGACSSAGCYSMTDEQVIEIYAFAREAFRGGQTAFQVQAYPFRMTADNMAAHRDSNHYEYWQMLKVGYDHFELTKKPPKIDVCEGRYVFNQVAEEEDGEFHPRRACPPSAAPQSLQLAYSAHKRKYDAEFEKAVKELEKPLKTPAIATLIAPKKPDQQSNIEQKAVSARQPLPSTAPEPTAPASVAPAPLPPADTTASIAIPTPSPAEPSGAGAKQPRKKKSWWRVW